MIYNFFNQHIWVVYLMVFVAVVVLPFWIFHIQPKEVKLKNQEDAKKIWKYVFLFWLLAAILSYLFYKK